MCIDVIDFYHKLNSQKMLIILLECYQLALLAGSHLYLRLLFSFYMLIKYHKLLNSLTTSGV